MFGEITRCLEQEQTRASSLKIDRVLIFILKWTQSGHVFGMYVKQGNKQMVLGGCCGATRVAPPSDIE